MKQKTILVKGWQMVMAACSLMVVATAMQSCSDEVLTGQPSWLGNSIYERLQEDKEANYSYTLRLIDDLGQKDVLGYTGSKTLFVADDNAYEEWFKNNSWGVKSYEQLTDAQKRLLLKNSMIDNAYLIELMSNVTGTPPVVGAMRRKTSASIYDSVYVMSADEMPNTSVWADLKAKGKSIRILKDETPATMIHFLPAYMLSNNITSEDLSVLTNGVATSINEAWVNGKRVIERDITCKNGYIQKVDGVIESSPNMAEIIRQHSRMSRWSQLLDRFSAPQFSAEGKREFNRIYNNEDSVYTLRYFSERSSSSPLNINVNFDRLVTETKGHSMLKFDPGWNEYTYRNTDRHDYHYDAGVMIVPTNDALEEWWNGEGLDLKTEYEEWDSIPETTLAKLIRVNMLESFSSSVPSKFGSVLNDAKEAMGITKDDIDSCFMGCNGVVYLVNKVFTPAEYSSVAYPATAHQSTMNIIYWAIEQLNFLPYLLSMDSRYALILPDNDAMKMYLDPSSYGNIDALTDMEAPQLIEFRYDQTKTLSEAVQASRFETTVDADGNITKGMRSQLNLTRDVINKMLNDLMDQLIIVLAKQEGVDVSIEEYVRQGYSYFKTKGGTLIKASMTDDGHVAFEGGWQIEHNNKKSVSTEEVTKTNGHSYIINSQMPLTAEKSLYMIMKEHDEYRGFLDLMESEYCDLLINKLSNKYNPGNSKNSNKNLRLFDNYNYTVFIPSTTSINQLQTEGILPSNNELTKVFADGEDHKDESNGLTYTSSLDSLCYAEGWYDKYSTVSHDSIMDMVETCMSSILNNFIRYHVMDRSVAVGMAPEANSTGDSYESMKRNPVTGRFFPLTVKYDQTSLTVTDYMNHTQAVSLVDGLYNNICREYWFEGSGNNARLFMGSGAVVHLVDQPLMYEEMRPWREVVEEYLRNN